MESAGSGNYAEEDAKACVAGGNVFIPISLGNHYYSSKVLQRIILEFIPKSRHSIIFLCDRLRFLSYRIRGETNLERIASTVQMQLDQMTRALANLGLQSHPNATVANWSLLDDDPRYSELHKSLEEFVHSMETVRGQANSYADRMMQRFGDLEKADGKTRMPLQLQYIMEETALSLYMTELRGHNVEIYRRGMGFVDYLYGQHPDALKLLTGKNTLERKFIAIEQWLGDSEESGRE